MAGRDGRQASADPSGSLGFHILGWELRVSNPTVQVEKGCAFRRASSHAGSDRWLGSWRSSVAR